MRSSATSVAAYLASLPPDRRAAIQAVRAVILKNLDKGYEEGMLYGGVGYYVPHSLFPAGYHCDPKQPLMFAGLASQKNHMALYFCSIFGSDGEATVFRQAWKGTGKKLDMGKGCIRFRRVEDLALDVIGDTIRSMPARDYIAYYEKARQLVAERPRKGPPGRKPAKTRTAAKKVASRKPAPRAARRAVAR